MYSYQHRYHAGNFADLHKHVILLAILTALQKKATPFCVLDAFAGEGIYDLNSKESQKNQEYSSGFGKAKKAESIPALVQELLAIAKSHQIEDKTLIYSGSPAIIAAKLRQQDQAICVENHPRAYRQLKRNFGRQQQMHLHKRDSIEAINALVPFKEKRGLIFIDPSYEVKEEYQTIGEFTLQIQQKFPQGIYMLWYPLLQEGKHKILLKELQKTENKIWRHELTQNKNTMGRMYGSGIVIINPPWRLEKIVVESLRFLRELC
jgi:23S rRNA (adenine2030-N6)-methyltransferase